MAKTDDCNNRKEKRASASGNYAKAQYSMIRHLRRKSEHLKKTMESERGLVSLKEARDSWKHC